jgi:adenosylcobyric acid synthase
MQSGTVYGTYLHGFFDSAACRAALDSFLREKKGIPPGARPSFDLKQYKEEQFDKLAEAVRESLDMRFIYKVLNEGA